MCVVRLTAACELFDFNTLIVGKKRSPCKKCTLSNHHARYRSPLSQEKTVKKKLLAGIFSLFGWLVADGWCWFVLREEYCWLVAAGCWWLVRSERKVLLAGG
jgi:hypothetical protein